MKLYVLLLNRKNAFIYKFKLMLNLLTPISDQDRISLYNINTTSSRQVMRIKNNYIN